MNLSEYRDLLLGNGLADSTVRVYGGTIRRLHIWCAANGYDPATMPPHAVRSWADTLTRSHASRKSAMAACRWYFRDRDDAPHLAIRVPRAPRPDPRPLDDQEMGRLLATARIVGGRRGLAVFCLVYTGARAAEVAGLRWEEWDGTHLRWWRDKIGDWHRLPVHPDLAVMLEDQRPEVLAGPMFVGDPGRGRATVHPTTIWGWCRDVGALCDVEVGPRRLRSTVATRILDATGSLEAAAAVLGHASTDTTRRYARTSERRLAEAVGTLG